MSADDILGGLCEPGRSILFVDDSGTPGKVIPDLLKDYRVIAGAVLTSQAYSAVKATMKEKLRSLGGFAEFHAVEIVHRQGTWRDASDECREEAFRFLQDTIVNHVDRIPYIYVSGEQWERDLRQRAIERGKPDLDHKAALDSASTHALLRYAAGAFSEYAVVADSPEPRDADIQINVPHGDWPGLYAGGVIWVDSRDEEGIQLADFIAYRANRIHHIKQRAIDGKKIGALDRILIDGEKQLAFRHVNLLNIQ